MIKLSDFYDNVFCMNINVNIKVPENGFKHIMAYNSYALRMVDSIILMGFAFKDDYGTILSSVSFTMFDSEFQKVKDSWANYIEKQNFIPSKNDYSLNTFEFKSPIDVNLINCLSNAEGIAELRISSFSHWAIEELAKKSTMTNKQSINIGSIDANPIAILRSKIGIQLAFIYDILNLSEPSVKGTKKK